MAEQRESTAEITGLFDNDALLQRRVDLHDDLGRISALLCEVQHDYNACIQDILTTNDELRRRGVDTSHIEAQISRQVRDADIA